MKISKCWPWEQAQPINKSIKITQLLKCSYCYYFLSTQNIRYHLHAAKKTQICFDAIYYQIYIIMYTHI